MCSEAVSDKSVLVKNIQVKGKSNLFVSQCNSTLYLKQFCPICEATDVESGLVVEETINSPEPEAEPVAS